LLLAAGYGVLQSRFVQKKLIGKVSGSLSEAIGADLTISRVRLILFKRIIVDDICLFDEAHDTLFHSAKLVAVVDSLSFKQKNIRLRKIELHDPLVYVKKDTNKTFNFSFLMQTPKTNDSLRWHIGCSHFVYRNGMLIFREEHVPDPVWFNLSNMNFSLEAFRAGPSRDISFQLKRLHFQSHDGFHLKNFSMQAQVRDGEYVLSNLQASTQYSGLLIDTVYFDSRPLREKNSWTRCPLRLDIKKFDFNFQDIAFILPDYASEGISVSLNGCLQGSVDALRGKGLTARIGDVTRATTDLYVNGLPDLENAYIFLNVYQSYANLNKIRDLQLPEKLKFVTEKMPSFMKNIGEFSYEGNFTGFLNDFVAYGNAYSDLGSLRCDISFKPSVLGVLKIGGSVQTRKLHFGKIFNQKRLGILTMSGKINGTVYNNQYDIDYDGTIDQIEINGYPFRNASLNGNLQNKLFNGELTILDPNLQGFYSGKLDLSGELPYFGFVSEVNYADLRKLNLTEDSLSRISFRVDANFLGNNIDNLRGNLMLDQLAYVNQNDSLFLDHAVITSTFGSDSSVFSLQSDWIDGQISGNYRFLDIVASLKGFLREYIPSLYSEAKGREADNNQFSFSFQVKNTDPLTRVFVPALAVQTPFSLNGFYHPREKSVGIETVIPTIRYANQSIEKLRIKINTTDHSLTCRAKTDVIHFSKSFKMYNLSAEASAQNDRMTTQVFWNNYGIDTYSGMIQAETIFRNKKGKYPEVSVSIEPTHMYIADSLWVIDPAQLVIDSHSVRFDEISIHHGDQSFQLDGILSEGESSMVFAKIRNVDLGLFKSVLGEGRIQGRMNGEARLSDAYRKFKLDLDLIVESFSFENNRLGDLTLHSFWDHEQDRLNTNLFLADNNVSIIDARGFIDPADHFVHLNMNFNQTPFSLLRIVHDRLFYNLQGTVGGSLALSGKTDALTLNGSLYPSPELGIGFRATKATYFTADPVVFRKDSILFSSMHFRDENNNQALLNGSIRHHNFQDMIFDLTVQSDKILALNTSFNDNEKFYGIAYANGILTIKGQGKEILLDGDFRTERGTAIFIPFNRRGKAAEYDFIRFVGTEFFPVTSDYIPQTSGVSMKFDVEVTPEAKVQLIFNSKAGDIIRGEGTGNLQINLDRNFDLEMYGDYIIDEGDYLFTLENVINKRFSIMPGSSIKWMGHPYEANLDIIAVYKVKTSLYDLFPDHSQNEEFKRRIPVDCKIYLKDQLQQPQINFAVDLPTAEERVKEQVAQMMATPEETNKQFISLLMLGRFYTPEFFNGKPTADTGVEWMGTTASELISNQLSNWLSQIIDEWNIGINIRPGNEISNDQVELALSTQILNDRVTIDGNIANNANPTINRSGDFVGDFDVNIKLTDNGKLQFKAYTHSNDNLIYDTAPTTQGIGFIYREEFNTLKELLEYYKKNLFRKRKTGEKNEKGNEEN